jgi:hypothetical protein
MRIRRFGAAVGGLLLLLGAGRVAAQGSTGTVSGNVVDEARQVVPGATVTLVDERSGASRAFTTDVRGAFSFAAVPPGIYTVRVELTGFQTLERRNNVLNASGQLALGDLKLAVGAMTELITVEAKGTQVEATNSDHTGLLTSTQIAQIQTKGRDVMNLLRLVPGVRYADDIDAMGDSFGSSVPHVGGQRGHWNAVTVDGLNGNELSGTNRFSSAINLDAIEEVKVMLNTYKAELGRTGGANVQIVTKGGGAEYRGNAYWYGRREDWNANRWENNKNGIAKPAYHFDTYGFNFGGPVKIPGVWDQKNDKKVFFYYSLEAPQVQKPGPLREYRMPTAAERNGDFSKTLDTNGKLIVIRDPLTGQPFPGNVIPSTRINPSTRALLDMLPLPNKLDSPTPSTWNFLRQETADNPRWNHHLRLDWRPSSKDSFFLTGRIFTSNQYGSEITAGPAKWGFFNAAYIFSDDSINFGHTHLFSSNLINEFQLGGRRGTEGFQTKDPSDLDRIRKANVGWNVSQAHPELNPLGFIPIVNFGLANTAANIDTPDFTYDNRLGATAQDYLFSLQDNLTWIKGSHSLKAGLYAEYTKNNEARGGTWMGQFNFGNVTTNPLNTGFAFSNALLGVYSQYTEFDAYRSTQNRAWDTEWYVQDTWKVSRRLTLDYGLRLLWYVPYYRADGDVANFVPGLYDKSKAPRLFRPAIVNGQQVAFDPVTGQTKPVIYIGTFVPGSGNQANGTVLASDPGVPKGFRENQGIHPEPRVGFAWDVFGNGKTAVHASAGLFHQSRLGGGSQGNLAANPPFIHSSSLFNATLADIGKSALSDRPGTVEALEPDAKTPSSYNWSLGFQQELGWGTVVDVSYAGSVGRHLEMYYNINAVPDGARYIDLHPENKDPRSNAALPADFLRPYIGYGDIRVRGDWGTSNYNALQVQVNRRYIRGLQFSLSYTYSKALGVADEDPGNLVSAPNRPVQAWLYAPLAQNQMHNFVLNYTWDVPKASKLWDNAVVRFLFDGWQVSGENAWVSGDWAPVVLTTVDNFDFTGGDGGTGSDLGGGFRVVRPRLVGDPKAGNPDPLTGWFNTAAFTRPAGRGDYGNTPRNVIQRPGISNWNLAAFKNFSLGEKRRFQLRAEAYNVLNHTQFSDINRSARFDAAGVQTDPTFGLATISRAPRIVQVSVRLSF